MGLAHRIFLYVIALLPVSMPSFLRPALPRALELLLALVLCGVVALWAVRMTRGQAIAVPPVATTGSANAGNRVEEALASARLFGSRRPGALSDNVRALGVIADASGRGSVIVSVDGQAPRVYRVGDTLDGRRVAAIRPDEIELESGGARQVFRLPAAQVAAPGLTIIGPGSSAASTPVGPRPTPFGMPATPPPYARPAPPPSMQPPQPMSVPPPAGPR